MLSAEAYKRKQEYIKFWRHQNPDKVKAQNKRYYEKNITPQKRRFYYLKQRYKIVPQEYETLLQTQQGKCAVCFGAGKLLIDHSHITGKVRGLLCSYCNKGLGNFKDSVQVIGNAIKYLSKYE